MNQYLTELARVLARKDIKSAPIENGRLPILLGKHGVYLTNRPARTIRTEED